MFRDVVKKHAPHFFSCCFEVTSHILGLLVETPMEFGF